MQGILVTNPTREALNVWSEYKERYLHDPYVAITWVHPRNLINNTKTINPSVYTEILPKALDKEIFEEHGSLMVTHLVEERFILLDRYDLAHSKFKYWGEVIYLVQERTTFNKFTEEEKNILDLVTEDYAHPSSMFYTTGCVSKYSFPGKKGPR